MAFFSLTHLLIVLLILLLTFGLPALIVGLTLWLVNRKPTGSVSGSDAHRSRNRLILAILGVAITATFIWSGVGSLQQVLPFVGSPQVRAFGWFATVLSFIFAIPGLLLVSYALSPRLWEKASRTPPA